MKEELLALVQQKRAWTEAAKCAEKEGSVPVADYCRAQAKKTAKQIVDFVRGEMGADESGV